MTFKNQSIKPVYKIAILLTMLVSVSNLILDIETPKPKHSYALNIDGMGADIAFYRQDDCAAYQKLFSEQNGEGFLYECVKLEMYIKDEELDY